MSGRRQSVAAQSHTRLVVDIGHVFTEHTSAKMQKSGPASTITAPSSKLNWIITGSQEVHSFVEFSDLDSPEVVALRGWSNPWLRPFPLTEERYVSPGLALYDITKD